MTYSSQTRFNRSIYSANRKSVSAFSLFEMLIVIAVMGVLAALLMGAVGKVRASAASVNCLNNLRQIGLGFNGYCQENEGRFPPHWGGKDGFGFSWYGFIAPYCTDWDGDPNASMSKIFYCPANPRPFLLKQNYQSLDSNSDQSYGYNFSSISTNPMLYAPYRRQAIGRRSQFVIVADIPTSGDPKDIVAFPGSAPNTPLYPATAMVSKRHAGSAGFLFLDGHAERLNTTDFLGKDFDVNNWVPVTE